MHSVNRRLVRRTLIVASAIVAAGLLAGCSTTREKAAEVQLNAARVTISEKKTKVVKAAGPVRVLHTRVVSDRKQSAYVVTVRNGSTKTIGDLPISVGYTLGSKRVYLNELPASGYFGAHLPPIAAHHHLSWVYETSHRLPAGARPFALVGAKQSPQALYTQTASTKAIASKPRKSRVRVKVTNLSGIPQYQLQVYAYSRGRRGYTAAASSTVIMLDPGMTETLHMPLVGRISSRRITVVAIPTILQ